MTNQTLLCAFIAQDFGWYAEVRARQARRWNERDEQTGGIAWGMNLVWDAERSNPRTGGVLLHPDLGAELALELAVVLPGLSRVAHASPLKC